MTKATSMHRRTSRSGVCPIPLPEPDAPAPSIDSTGIRNAASNYLVTESIPQQGFSPPIIVHRPDVIAAGEILRITGSCLGPLDPISSQFEQAGVQVTF